MRPSIEAWRAAAKPSRRPFGASAVNSSQLDRLAGPGPVAGFPEQAQRALAQSGGWLSRPVLGGRSELESPFFDSWVVYACTRLLQRAAASVPWRLWTGDDPKSGQLPAKHPMVRLFKHPNRNTSWSQLVASGVIHRKLTGEDFWFLVDRNGAPLVAAEGEGAPSGLARVELPIRGAEDAQIVSVGGSSVSDARDPGTGLVIAWWYAQAASISRRYHTASVVPFLDYNPADPCRGVGDAEVAARALSVAFQIERYQEAVMRNGGPGAFLVNETGPVDPDEESRQQEQLDARQEDPASYAKLRLLSGKWSVIPNPATPKALQSTEAMEYYRDVVASIFGVPLPCIGIMENATFRNSEEAWAQFWLGVVDYLRSVEDVINSQFLPSLADPSLRELQFGFDIDSIAALAEDRVAKVSAAAELANKGVGVSFEEAATILELDIEPTKFGATTFMPSTAATAEQVISGETWTTPDPAAPADGGGEAPLPADDDDGEDAEDSTDDAKALGPVQRTRVGRSHPELSAEERSAYARRFDEDVIREGDKRLRAHVARWFRRYHEEQVRILREVAENGVASRSVRARASAVAKEAPNADDIERYLMVSRSKWRRLLREAISTDIDGIFQRAAQDMAQELGSISIPMSDPRVLETLASQKIQVVEGVESTLADQVRRILLEGLGESTTTGTLQQAVREVLPELEGSLASAFATKDARAQTIARTETGHAANTARFMQMDAAGVKRHQWVASNDAATRESHDDLDGEVRDIGTAFKPRLRYPHDPEGPAGEVINCFLPGTIVEGRFVAGSEADYAGSAWEIETARGRRLRVTPNHPVLTSRGWVPARQVAEGDYLFGHESDVRGGVQRNVDNQHVPSPVEHIFQALASDGRLSLAVVGALDFHGDAISFVREVDVPRTDRNLSAESVEQREQFALVLADSRKALGHGSRASLQRLDCISPSSSGAPSARKLTVDGRPIVLLAEPLQPLSFGPAAHASTVVSKDALERDARDAALGSKRLAGDAGLVTADKVVSVREFKFAGHVYDLQTKGGWIVASGIVCSNCRCLAAPVDTED